MIKRHLSVYLERFSSQYPIVTLTGPRQSGKSTLAKLTFPEFRYVSLEDPDIRQMALQDPREFLERYSQRVIIHEIQRAPELFSYLQTHVDKTNTPGQFILTGSEQFELNKNISQSLAGRTAILRLLPLSQSELFDREAQTCWLNGKLKISEPPSINKYQAVLQGGYPRVIEYQLNPFQFHRDYFETYLTRDLRQLLSVVDLEQFSLFVRLLAGRSGLQLNYSNLSSLVGVTDTTIKRWIGLLKQSYLISLLQPYYRNFNKRLIKSPKIYFLDTGLLCFLLNIRNEEQLKTHPNVGAIFETYAYSEMLKSFFNQSEVPPVFYWQSQGETEIDLLFEHSVSHYCCAEIKLASTISPHFFKGLHNWNKIAEPHSQDNYLIYGGDEWFTQSHCQLVPWYGVS